jgi:hypothetical protein
MAPSSFASKAATNDIPMLAVINALDQIGRLPNLSVAKPLSALRYINALMACRVVNSCKGGEQCSEVVSEICTG